MKDNIMAARKTFPEMAQSTFYWRVKRYGTPFKEKDGRVKHFINDIPAIEVAKQNGISAIQFRQRLNRGWSVRDAATKKMRNYNE